MNEPTVPNSLLPAVLRRAAELQRPSPSDADDSALSLAQIVEIGAEVGLAADALQRAADSIDRPESAGSPDCVEIMIPHALTDTQIGALVGSARKTSGKFGEVVDEGTTTVWHAAPGGSMVVNFVRESDRTLIQVLGNQGNPDNLIAIFSVLVPLFGLMAGMAAFKDGLGVQFAVLAGSGVAVTGLAAASVRRSITRTRQRLRALAERLKADSSRLLTSSATQDATDE